MPTAVPPHPSLSTVDTSQDNMHQQAHTTWPGSQQAGHAHGVCEGCSPVDVDLLRALAPQQDLRGGPCKGAQLALQGRQEVALQNLRKAHIRQFCCTTHTMGYVSAHNAQAAMAEKQVICLTTVIAFECEGKHRRTAACCSVLKIASREACGLPSQLALECHRVEPLPSAKQVRYMVQFGGRLTCQATDL